MCPPALYCCVRLCLAILYICLPALDVASSSFDFEKHKLFGVYGGVIAPLLVGHCVRVVLSLFCFLLSTFLLVIVPALSSFCFFLSPVFLPFLLVTVSVLSPFCFLLSPFLFPFLLVIVSALSPFLSPFLLVVPVLSPFCFLFPQTVYC